MSLRRKIKRMLTPPPIGAILTLHRVNTIDPQRLYYNEHLKISPDYLELLILETKKMGFRFVSMEELHACVMRKKGKKLLAITLDDGYADNFEQGLPVFKKHNVPFCIYVTTGMVERNITLWWYILEDIILENEQITLSDGQIFHCKTKEQKEAVFLEIRTIIMNLDQKELPSLLPALFSNYDLDINKYRDIGLSWEQISALAEEKLATIACHTHSHYSFNACQVEEIIEDIEISLKKVHANSGIKMEHFCFPFGDSASISPKHIEVIKKLRFKSATTTEHGFVVKKSSTMELPRIFTTERSVMPVILDLYKKSRFSLFR